MNRFKEAKILIYISLTFAVFYFLPVDSAEVGIAASGGLALLKWYAREHVILCLIPAFFIAGAISIFVSQNSVIKYFGSTSRKWISYSVASVSGSVLAVCSCTVLPLFAGIYKRGASIGPATTFLYSGPAINVLAIIMTARILGIELGIARAVGAVGFSILIGIIMSFLYRKEESERPAAAGNEQGDETAQKNSLMSDVLYFGSMIGVLVFANWGQPEGEYGFFSAVYSGKWIITAIFSLMLSVFLIRYIGVRLSYTLASVVITAVLAFLIPAHKQLIFVAAISLISIALFASGGAAKEWLEATWGYAKQILPLLAIGVFVSGMLLGSPGNQNGLIPDSWIRQLVGGNSISSNLFASIVGAFMYFATLTEVPILQGLLNSGMGKGPALSLLLSGPALSLPSMIVLNSIIGLQKTIVYVALVIVVSTAAGLVFGLIF